MERLRNLWTGCWRQSEVFNPALPFSGWYRACSPTVFPKMNTPHLQRICQLPRMPVCSILAIPLSAVWGWICTGTCTSLINFQNLFKVYSTEEGRNNLKGANLKGISKKIHSGKYKTSGPRFSSSPYFKTFLCFSWKVLSSLRIRCLAAFHLIHVVCNSIVDDNAFCLKQIVNTE